MRRDRRGGRANGTQKAPDPLAVTVTAITPTNGKLAAGTAITNLAGTGFVNGATVTIGGAAATSVVWVSSTQLTCVAPVGTAGVKDVVVTNPSTVVGTGSNLYTYNPLPTVTAITPNNGSYIGGVAITNLAGTGFINGATVTIGGVAATSVVRVSSTQITCTTPAGSVGAKNVVVTNPDTQSATGAGLYTNNAPTVTAITPNNGSYAGSTAITNLAGTGFVNGATVTIGGVAATSVVWVSSTQLTCTTPAGTVGAQDVVVTNPDTITATGAGLYTYTFTPTSLAGLLLWAKSESLAVGANATWADSSGNSQTINCGNSPVGAADAAYGGLTSLTMNGTNNTLVTATAMVFGPHTIFIVGKMTGTASYFAHRNDGGTLNEYLYGSTGNSANITKSGTTSLFNISSNWGIGTVPRTIVRTFDGTTAGHNVRINGTTQARLNVSTGVNPGTATTSNKLGIYCTSAAASPSAGTIAEVLVYNSALSAGDIALVEAYLRTKFGHY